MPKQEVAKPAETGVAVIHDYGEMKHEGFEDTKVTDLSIPFISVMQSNSAQVEDDDHPAKSGDLVNSVSGEVVPQPLIAQPVHKDHLWAAWVPRSKGGGRGDSYTDDDPMVQAIIKNNGGSRIPPEDSDGKRPPFKTPDGLFDLVETHYVYVLILDPAGKEPLGYAVLPFSSTKIKVQKDWWTNMYTLRGAPPLQANRATISTTKQTKKGKTFYNFLIRPFGDTWMQGLIPPDEAGIALIKHGQEFRDMIQSGLATAAVETEDSAGETSGAKPSGDDANDMPF